MNKYIAVAATTKRMKESWHGTSEFTDNAITKLAITAIGKPVLKEFDKAKIIGEIISAKNKNGKLIINVNINSNEMIASHHRIVPGFIVERDSWNESTEKIHRVIDEVKSACYGLTEHPIDNNLSLTIIED